MLVKKILKVVLLLLSGLFVVLQGLSLGIERAILGIVILGLLIWLYVGYTKRISRLFLLFLAIYAFGELISIAVWYKPEVEENEIDYLYFITNGLFILAYIVLIIKTIRQLNLKKVVSELKISIVILLVLDVFCVTLISDTTADLLTLPEYIIEFVYNAVIMILLSFALIDYMYRNNNKSMLFLIGTIFMVFSEIIQLAYYYILNDDSLGYVYSIFLIIAFAFYYIQSQFIVTDPTVAYVDEESIDKVEV